MSASWHWSTPLFSTSSPVTVLGACSGGGSSFRSSHIAAAVRDPGNSTVIITNRLPNSNGERRRGRPSPRTACKRETTRTWSTARWTGRRGGGARGYARLYHSPRHVALVIRKNVQLRAFCGRLRPYRAVMRALLEFCAPVLQHEAPDTLVLQLTRHAHIFSNLPREVRVEHVCSR